MSDTYKRWLQDASLKVTKHRLVVLDILANTKEFLTADDVFVEAKREPGDLSLSTVYRILDSFVERGLAAPINMDTAKQTHYELAHAQHAHHLICNECGRVVHVEHCPLEPYEQKIAKEHGFRIDDHKLELFGLCQSCQENSRS